MPRRPPHAVFRLLGVFAPASGVAIGCASAMHRAAPRAGTAARTADTAVFVLRAGGDTGAVDRVVWADGRVSGEAVAARTLAVDYRLALTSDGEVRSYAFRLGRPPATLGDSVAFVAAAPGSAGTVVSRGRSRGRMPLWNATPGLYDVLLRRAHAAAGATAASATAASATAAGTRAATRPVAIPLFRFGAASVRDSALVSFFGPDSARILLRTDGAAPVEMLARVDGAGGLLRATVPAEGWVVERVSGLPRAAYALAPAYGAPAGAPYTAEEVRIAVDGGVTLAGTLTRPAGVSGPVPAVVLLHGSTPSDRNNAGPPLPGLFWQLADTLSHRGVAVLRYDQRGVGASGGVSDSATVHVRAADARAALAFLRRRPEIDAARLGVFGLSEGALAAALVAAALVAAALVAAALVAGPTADSAAVPIRAVVLASSPGRPGRDLSAYQTRTSAERFLQLTGPALGAALAAGRAHDDSALRRGRGHEAALLAYDPLPAARRLRVPVLVVRGGTDLVVPPGDAERLADAARSAGNRDVTLRVFPGVNDVLTADQTGDWRRYVASPSLVAPAAVRGVVADWLVARLAPTPGAVGRE